MFQFKVIVLPRFHLFQYASSLVTYIIVLSQFSMGQPKNNSVCNVTHNTTGTD